MSIPCGPMLDELLSQMNNPSGTADEQFKAQAMQKLNESYRDVYSTYDWGMFKTKATLVDSVYIVPADCRNILHVSDQNKVPYNFVAGNNRRSDFRYNWYFDTPVATPLAEGTTLNVGEYSTALSSTAEFPATTCAGEYARMGSNTGLYKIATWTSTSAMTIADHFRGDQLSSSIFQIRPRGTQVLAFCGMTGNAITPVGVEVTYVKFPLPLYDDTDLIELPGYCTAVKIKALQKLLAMQGFSSAAERMKTDFTAALSEMKASEPSQPIIQPTRMFSHGRRHGITQSYMLGESLMNNG